MILHNILLSSLIIILKPTKMYQYGHSFIMYQQCFWFHRFNVLLDLRIGLLATIWYFTAYSRQKTSHSDHTTNPPHRRWLRQSIVQVLMLKFVQFMIAQIKEDHASQHRQFYLVPFLKGPAF